MDWKHIRHFTPEEFDDPDAPGSHRYMDPGTILLLDMMRERTGWPIITHNRFGVRGCVCKEHTGHSKNSRHYFDHPDGCSAVDWHFATDADSRAQAFQVLASGFTGIGIYYDWHWKGKPLTIGFHTDTRKGPQLWKRVSGKYIYFLN